MTPDRYAQQLLSEVEESASGPLATASREKILGIFGTIETTDLNTFDADKLLEVVRDGRRGTFGDLRDLFMKSLLRRSGINLPQTNDILPIDMDDRLRASLLIIQKHPDQIPIMLDILWDIFDNLQNYGASEDVSEHIVEVRNIVDVIFNIAIYAVARLPHDEDPTVATYLFSGNERFIMPLCQKKSSLVEAYTYPSDVDDKVIQSFITALRTNKHTQIFVQHATEKTPFIQALIRALNE